MCYVLFISPTVLSTPNRRYTNEPLSKLPGDVPCVTLSCGNLIVLQSNFCIHLKISAEKPHNIIDRNINALQLYRSDSDIIFKKNERK